MLYARISLEDADFYFYVLKDNSLTDIETGKKHEKELGSASAPILSLDGSNYEAKLILFEVS